MNYDPVGTDVKEQFDRQFETGDVGGLDISETAPTCTASCCTGSFSECSL